MEDMSGVTKEDVVKMMKSVVCVNVDLYPTSYNTDRKFCEIISSVIKERGFFSDKTDMVFDMSFNTLLKCIDDKLNLSKYITEFKNEFDLNAGIGADYDRLVSKYSSPEIIVFYGLFPDLSYFHINIHIGNDTRPSRKKTVTTLYLPDLQIDTISVKLRDLFPQNIVDEMNKYIIDTTGFEDNVMSKKNTFMANSVDEFFEVIENFCQRIGNDDLYKEMYSAFSFLDIDEIKQSIMIIITDWPIL